MTRFSHVITGTITAVAVLLAWKNPVNAVAFFLGNLFPDVDVKWNNMSNFKRAWYAHRGITHSLVIPLLLLLSSGAIFILETAGKLPVFPFVSSGIEVTIRLSEVVLFFALGVLLHLFFDAMTPTGIPKGLRYYPRFRLPTVYRTGELRELLVVAVYCVVLSFLILRLT
jgi:membrane-bound metal-dependent hydrolase YbcI (DUF457 family)